LKPLARAAMAETDARIAARVVPTEGDYFRQITHMFSRPTNEQISSRRPNFFHTGRYPDSLHLLQAEDSFSRRQSVLAYRQLTAAQPPTVMTFSGSREFITARCRCNALDDRLTIREHPLSPGFLRLVGWNGPASHAHRLD
jgi:hypothetical protein